MPSVLAVPVPYVGAGLLSPAPAVAGKVHAAMTPGAAVVNVVGAEYVVPMLLVAKASKV